MRKIEKELNQAIATNSYFNKGNTEFCVDTVKLHGNEIARRFNGVWMVNLPILERWNTVTTRSRLNALGLGVSTKRGVLSIDAPTYSF